MIPGAWRTGAIVVAFVLGVLFPVAEGGPALIRPLIMVMLGLTFLEVRLDRAVWEVLHWKLIAANFVLAGLAWGLALPLGRDFALAAFFVAVTPTATAAPVITGLLGGRVPFVAMAFLGTNLAVAVALPFLLAPLIGDFRIATAFHVARSVAILVLVPLTAAVVLRRFVPGVARRLRGRPGLTFGIWVTILYLATAQAVAFVKAHPELPIVHLAGMALLSLVLCAVNFSVGRWLGGADRRLEAGQSLGQKNTTLTLYLALAYANPLVTMGPTFYVLWHNLWNSWQMHRHGRAVARAAAGKG